MTVRLRSKQPPVSDKNLVALEHLHGLRLPSSYRGFLRYSDGGKPEPNQFSIPGTGNSSGVTEFLGLAQVQAEKRHMSHRLPTHLWPIAYAEGGNLLCISVGPTDGGVVFFWDHELEPAQQSPGIRPDVQRLASDFDEFLASLTPFDISNIELKPGQVKGAWIDPKLLEELKKKGQA